MTERDELNPPLLDVRDLTVEFATRRGNVRAIDKVNVSVAKSETVGIVGESGSGKSVTSLAVLRILDRAGHIADGSITFSGIDVHKAPESEMRLLRGREMSMVFQNPRAALNPIRKIGRQIEDVLLQHVQASRDTVRAKVIDILNQVRIARPEERYHAYPFELSGGMCQRVVIALALACRPQLLIADEPTTGLDVMTQKTVMDLIVGLTNEREMSTILITHDLGLASAYCDKIVVMEQGKVVETASAQAIFRRPEHRYTRKLMRATPRPGIGLRDLLPDDVPTVAPLVVQRGAQAEWERTPLLSVEGLVKEYPHQSTSNLLKRLLPGATPSVKEPPFRAVDNLSFHVRRGESVGLVGESGCGKSTTSMMVMRLLDPTEGRIMFDGADIGAIPAAGFATSALRKRIQMVFQDPTESLNPRYTAARAIADPLLRMGHLRDRAAVHARVEILAERVGLPLNLLDRFPHQLSGGQKARVGIARAIALDPDLVILDEPTAALDVSVQAIVLNLLQELKEQLGMSYLFVSHDLYVVRLICERVIVMRQGSIVEEGPVEEILTAPKVAYTRELIAAIPHLPVMAGAK